MLACYCLVRFRLSSQPLYLIAVIFALMMGILHKGLVVYAPFLVIVMLLVRVDRPGARGHVAARVPSSHRRRRFSGRIRDRDSKAEDQLREVSGAQLLLKATASDGLVEHTSEARGEKALTDGRTAYGVRSNTRHRYTLHIRQ